ncbi:MAG: hypothetical protein ACJ789_06175 [Thermomicrobiales bacterium]
MRGRGALRLAAGFSLLLVLLGISFSQASAGTGTSSITIHNRICPTGYTGTAYFADCHGNPQTSHLEFTIDGPMTETFATGDDGNVAFQALPAGTYDISGGVPGEFASTVVYCSANDDPNNQVATTMTGTGYSLELADNSDVICDWYNIPEDLSGTTPTPASTTTPTTALPSTGVGETTAQSSSNFGLYGFAVVALSITALAVRRRAVRPSATR